MMDKVMEIDRLLKLFSGESDSRYWIRRPFRLDGRIVATNGHMMISVPLIDGYVDCPDDNGANKVADLFTQVSNANVKYRRMEPDDIDYLAKLRCEMCEGNGQVEECEECEGHGIVVFNNSYSQYEHYCKSCDGNGDTPTTIGGVLCPRCLGLDGAYDQSSSTEIEGLLINPAYAEVLSMIPSVEIAAYHDMIVFQSPECYGMIKAKRR